MSFIVSQTSSRKYNIDIHTQRKHQRARAKHLNEPSNPYFSNNFRRVQTEFSCDLNSSMEQPSSSFFLIYFLLS